MLRGLGDKKNQTSEQFHVRQYLHKCYLPPHAERYTFVTQGEDYKIPQK